MKDAYLIAGLGNPGKNYVNTRHNAGFLAIDCLCRRIGCELKLKPALEARCGGGSLAGQKVLLCQPQTFMNLSGRAMAKLTSFYKIGVGRILILADDVDGELGKIRLRRRGSSGGHKGLQSIEEELGTDCYARLKIGIGRRKTGSVSQHVLGRFEESERKLLACVLERVADQVVAAVTKGLESAMSLYNGLVTKTAD